MEANWKNLNESPDGGSNTLTMANIFLMLVFDIGLYMALAYIFDSANPGKYGIPKKWNYLFKKKNLRKFNFLQKRRKDNNSNNDVEMQNVCIRKILHNNV